MTHADDSRNLGQMIRTILLAIGRMFGLSRATAAPSPTSDKPSEGTENGRTADDAKLRFRRALVMLDLAVVHARHGFHDTACTNLNAAWADLRHNDAARIHHRATAALVFALDARVRQAVTYLDQALDASANTHNPLSPVVQRRIHRLCTETMEHLPHNQHIEQLTRDALIARERGDYVTALRLLDQTDQVHSQYARLIAPRTNSNRLTAWYAVLEDMHNRGGYSTRIILDAFRKQQSVPASAFAGSAA